jgi:hypothetical protein
MTSPSSAMLPDRSMNRVLTGRVLSDSYDRHRLGRNGLPGRSQMPEALRSRRSFSTTTDLHESAGSNSQRHNDLRTYLHPPSRGGRGVLAAAPADEASNAAIETE